jgi:hypothetical protein
MKKRVTPQEKKRLAYERDHYVSGGESRHAFRKNWPKKKAMFNQKHRHRAAQALHRLEKLGDLNTIESNPIEVTSSQLNKIDPREKFFKYGVRSLREFVEQNRKKSKERPLRTREQRESIRVRYTELIISLERNVESAKAKELLREISSHDWGLRLFLSWNPEWRPRLEKKLLEARRSEEKAKMRREKKETEKQRAKRLSGTAVTQTKSRVS